MAGFFGSKKKEKIYFEDRLAWRYGRIMTHESDVKKFFNSPYLEEDIFVIEAPVEISKRAEKEGKKLTPPLRLYVVQDSICYHRKDEERLYYFLLDIKEKIEKEREALPKVEPERRMNLSQALSNNKQTTSPVIEFEEPSETENKWAEEKLAEELQEAERDLEETTALVAANKEEPKAEAEDKPRKKRKSLGRTNQIMTRLTDAELVQFQRRVKRSGLAQGDFLRNAALTGQIVIEERSAADVALLDELALLRAEIGRQGGMLKMIIKPNEGQRELLPNEWEELIEAIRNMENTKQRLIDLEVKLNGISKT